MKRQGIGAIWIGLIVVIVVIAVGLYSILATQTVSEVKTEDNIGKNVRVRGEVETTIKIGSLSGYTLKDDTGTIAVSSDDLPSEGETVTASGVLIRDTIFGYYIRVN